SRFREVEEDALPVVARVIGSGAIGDLDMEPTRGTCEQRQSGMRGVPVSQKSCPDETHPGGEVGRPERWSPIDVGLSPDVVDEDVESTVGGFDAADHLRDLLGVEVVADVGFGFAALAGDERRGAFYRLVPSVVGGSIGRRPAGAVDEGSGTSEIAGDGTAGTARGPGDEGDAACQGPIGERGEAIGGPGRVRGL